MTYEKFKINMVKQGVDIKSLTKFMLKYSTSYIGISIGVYLVVKSCMSSVVVMSYIVVGLLLLLYLSSFSAFVENRVLYDKVANLVNKNWILYTIVPLILGIIVRLLL